MMFAPRFPLRLLSLLPCLWAASIFAEPLPVGCQGRIVPESQIIRLAAPADQGTPIIAALHIAEGDTLESAALVATLAAEKPAQLLLLQAEQKHQAAQASLAVAEAVARQRAAELQLQKLDAQDALSSAQSALAVARTQASRQRLDAAGLQEIEARLAQATQSLADLRAARPSLQAQLDATVKAAQTQVDETSGSRQRIAVASRTEAETTRTLALREHDAKINQLSGEVAALQARLAQGKTFHQQPERQGEEITALENQVAAAQQRLAALDEISRLDATVAATEISSANAAVAEASTGVQLAQARLNLTRVRSPLSQARVLRILARPGETVGPDGVAEIADLSRLTVEAEVSVADFSRVQTGQSATIQVPGRQENFSGKVTRLGMRVAPSALLDDNPAAFKDLRVIPVTILLDDAATLQHYTGAQVTVRILP